MSGYFLFHRDIFRHEMFSDEPFTEREAWVWLIGEAAWKPTKVRAGRGVFDLDRGQLVHAHRFLAQAWGWHPSKVYRFLTRLAQAGMIETLAKQEATLITICNYDKYQTPRNAGETQTEEPAKRSRNREEELNTRKEDLDDEGATDREKARTVLSEVEPVIGIDPKFVPPEWCGAENFIAGWISKGWKPEIISASIKSQAGIVRASGRSPPTRINYYRNGIADAHAQAEAPLPAGKIVPQTTFEARRAAKSSTPNDGLRQLREELFGCGEGGIRAGPGRNDVRLLPKGGGE